jgi:O-antigen/teichoic acid export membrane protein
VTLVAASELGGFVAVPVAAATGSAIWACAAMSVGTLVGAAGSLVVLLRFRRAGTGAKPAFASFVRASVPLGLSQVFIALGTRADTLLAGAVSGLLAASTFEGSWRTYQLGQYAAGAVATASAPFVADALGAGRHAEAVRLLRRLIGGLFLIGIAVSAVLYIARNPIARVLTGTLAGPVSGVLPVVAVVSPVAAIGLVAFYTLISQEGQRRFVLTASAVGAAVNIVLAGALARGLGARGVMIGCTCGLVVTNVMLLLRLASLVRHLRVRDRTQPAATEPSALAHPWA